MRLTHSVATTKLRIRTLAHFFLFTVVMKLRIEIKKILVGIAMASFVFCYAGQAEAFSPQVLSIKMRADALLKKGEVKRSVLLYEKVLREEPHFANVYYNLATAYYLQGEMGKALENLERFIELNPYDAEALYNLGCFKLRVGDFNAADVCFQRARDCSTSSELGQNIRQALQFLKDLSHPSSLITR